MTGVTYFTGVDQLYEAPEHLNASDANAIASQVLVHQVITYLIK
jgi:hypothetical protein